VLVMVMVDQPNTIRALPIAVARAMGPGVAYLPGQVHPALERVLDPRIHTKPLWP
jgi:hypothetical protein